MQNINSLLCYKCTSQITSTLVSFSDTQKFFKALSAVGTDFGTINAMFPSRTRAEIKRKFKREERINRKKVDQALCK